MIYMRERHQRRPNNNERDDTTRNYLDELKSKFTRKNTDRPRQENQRRDNEAKPPTPTPQPHKYAIGKSRADLEGSQSKFSESIIVHELPHNPNPLFSRRPLAPVKCFDIQILNDLSSSRFRAQAYIQLLEREKDLKSREILSLREQLAAQREGAAAQKELEELRRTADTYAAQVERYGRYFSEGRDVLLAAALELVDSRNDLSGKPSEERVRGRQESLSRCIERVERVLSVYSGAAQTGRASLGHSVDELWGNVKYQEKIIELMRQNESNLRAKNYHHENTLLRYEVNRLSTHNEELLRLAAQQDHSLHLHPHHKPQESIILHQQDSEIEEDSHEDSSLSHSSKTPFQNLKEHFSPSIDHPFSTLDPELKAKLDQELSEYKKRVGVLEVEKEYVLEQLEQLQNSQRELKQELKALLEENEQLREQAGELRQEVKELKDSYEVAKESEKVLEEQNDLLKDKLKFLFKPNGKDTVTVEELLKLLKRKELANYHQALMELISKYELRISELTNSFLYERELKQHSLTYCKGLFNIVQATNSHAPPSLEEIIDYINKYEDIMAELRENEIDVYLRKIKSFSIGIDESSADTIKEELKDYVYQLQTRLPTLSEEYLEDGSSIADSYHNSVDRFD